jgi:hypothetical protein
MASDERILMVVVGLADAFGRQLSEAGQLMYLRALREVPDDALAAGADAVLHGTREFMPTPGQLRFACLNYGDSPETRAVAAWDVAHNAIRYGAMQSVDFADKLINATIRSLGGWPRFCRRRREELTWVRKEFLETYRHYLERGVDDARTDVLPGEQALNRHYNVQRYGPPPVLLIGSQYRTSRPALTQ